MQQEGNSEKGKETLCVFMFVQLKVMPLARTEREYRIRGIHFHNVLRKREWRSPAQYPQCWSWPDFFSMNTHVSIDMDMALRNPTHGVCPPTQIKSLPGRWYEFCTHFVAL